MPFTRLPESVQTLYAELLDQLRAADAEAAVAGVKGAFVSKVIRGRTYWYEQRSEGSSKRQIYLGAETPELLASIRGAGTQRRLRQADERRRRELVTMLATGGMSRESAAVGVVLRVLSDASVFRAGGVLVGTQAFSCIANMLGVAFEKETLRTADIDVAHDATIPLGFTEPPKIDFVDRLRQQEPGFFAVPGMDSREASTSFKVRGRDLRVDFLTPAPDRSRSTKPVYLPHLGIAAQPLQGLDYLIEGSIDAAAVVGSGVRVHVPSPARFALHKLWVASRRNVAEAAKSRKDLRQATQLIEVLIDDRPSDLEAAWEAAAASTAFVRATRTSLSRIDAAVAARLRRLLRLT